MILISVHNLSVVALTHLSFKIPTTMTSNVGLTTPRGSGTSGYVQRNLSALKPRDQHHTPYPSPTSDLLKHRQRKPDQQILDHDRLREIEVKVFDLRDSLEEEGEIEEEEIERRCEELRGELLKGGKEGGGKGGKGGKGGEGDGARDGKRQFKPHQVHEQAEAKIVESERLRRALGIRSDYEEGSHWNREEGRLREGVGGEGR